MNYTIPPSCQINHIYLNELYLKIFGYKQKGIFVEIGAYDGSTFSNTYGLSEAGWRGLYVEPMVEFLDKCKLNHKLNKEIQYANCAAGSYNGKAKFYMGDWASTICEEIMKADTVNLNENRYRIVDVFTLDHILYLYNIPVDFDLLVIDTEGNDLEVLKSFTIERYKPKMVIVEYTHERFEEFVDYFNNFNYKLVNKDSCNLIFVRGDLWKI